jgi:hypothetical protein
MTKCQGKDGPNALLPWKQGDRLPLEGPEGPWLDRLDAFPLSGHFSFSCWCPNDHLAEFLGEIEDGRWVRTMPASDAHQ